MNIDLTGILTPEALRKLKKKEGMVSKAKRSTTKPVEPAPVPETKPSPWELIAAILVETRVTCTCGIQWRIPASEDPLVRFKHKKNGSLWEVANHPAVMRPGLPRKIRILEGSCHACPSCWGEDFEEESELQMELEFENEVQH